MSTKYCPKCSTEKDLELFQAGRGKFNKKNYCQECSNKYNKEYYLSNKVKLIQAAKEYQKKNPDKTRCYVDRYRKRKGEKTKSSEINTNLNNAQENITLTPISIDNNVLDNAQKENAAPINEISLNINP